MIKFEKNWEIQGELDRINKNNPRNKNGMRG